LKLILFTYLSTIVEALRNSRNRMRQRLLGV
jgi:hypothetical protein